MKYKIRIETNTSTYGRFKEMQRFDIQEILAIIKQLLDDIMSCDEHEEIESLTITTVQ